jgi:DUF4097 and DUF4098 domain-containing protein YvlB
VEDAMRRESFETPGPLTLDIRVPSGDIALEAVEGTETIVEISGSPELEEEARIEIHPKRDGHEVSVIIEKRSGLFRAFREEIRVRVTSPPGADVEVSTASADVDARGAFGGAQINTASGDVEIESVREGDVVLQTASGDIVVGIKQGSKLWIDAKSMSGETSSELDIGDVPTDGEGPLVEVRATAMSGDIRVKRT